MKARFTELWKDLGGKTDASKEYSRLHTLYTAKERFYHNLDHIADCLEKLETVKQKAHNPEALELALFYHDAIYETHRHNNEDASAHLMLQNARAAKLHIQPTVEAYALIKDTSHRHKLRSPDSQLIADIDLSILGEEPQVFDTYQENIRKEYAWVEQDTYNRERAKILQGFLDRRNLFNTEHFQTRYEEQARENLKRAISELR